MRSELKVWFINNRYLLIPLVIIHLVFFTIQLQNRNCYLSDSREYLYEAENIVASGEFYCGDLKNPLNKDLYSKRPPVYPLFIALSKSISKSDLLLLFFQSILSILSILIIRDAFLKMGYNPKYDFVFLILLVFSPAQMIYANMVMSETLFQFILSLALYSIVLYYSSGKVVYFAYFGILTAISALVKPVMYFFAIPFCLYAIYVSINLKSLKPAAIGIISILIIQAYTYRNYIQTGYWHFSSIQTINLVHYNTYYFNVQKFGQDSADNFLNSQLNAAAKLKSYPEQKRFLANSSRQLLRDNAFAYAWFHAKGTIRFFLDPGRFDLSSFLGLEPQGNVGLLSHLNSGGSRGAIHYLQQQQIWLLLILMLIILFNFIKLCGLMAFLFIRQIDIRFRIMIIFLTGYVALATGPLGASRFAMPFIPFIILATLMAIPLLKNTRWLGQKP